MDQDIAIVGDLIIQVGFIFWIVIVFAYYYRYRYIFVYSYSGRHKYSASGRPVRIFKKRITFLKMKILTFCLQTDKGYIYLWLKFEINRTIFSVRF